MEFYIRATVGALLSLVLIVFLITSFMICHLYVFHLPPEHRTQTSSPLMPRISRPSQITISARRSHSLDRRRGRC